MTFLGCRALLPLLVDPVGLQRQLLEQHVLPLYDSAMWDGGEGVERVVGNIRVAVSLLKQLRSPPRVATAPAAVQPFVEVRAARDDAPKPDAAAAAAAAPRDVAIGAVRESGGLGMFPAQPPPATSVATGVKGAATAPAVAPRRGTYGLKQTDA